MAARLPVHFEPSEPTKRSHSDFIQILLLRGAFLAAICNEPAKVLKDDVLTQRVQVHLHLNVNAFSTDPEAKGSRARKAEAALNDVFGYPLCYDLQRGWRFTNSNLEQLQLLQITYDSLDACRWGSDAWQDSLPLLAHVALERREIPAHELVDITRRKLCLKTIYLNAHDQEQIYCRLVTVITVSAVFSPYFRERGLLATHPTCTGTKWK